MTRLVFSSFEDEFIRINEIGQLEGSLDPFREAFFILISKLNITWIPVKNAQTIDGIEIEEIKTIEQDEADLVRCDHAFVNGLSANVSASTVYSDGWCKIASSPLITSFVLTDGPESALKQMRIEFLVLVLIGLALMMYLAHRRLAIDGLSPIWIVFASMIRQYGYSYPKRLVFLAYMVLIVASLLIQILYGSLLHTERTSISSFVKIDSYENVQSYQLKKFVFDVSPCSKLLGDKPKLEIISLTDASKQDYGWCVSSRKCTWLISNPEYYIFKALSCSIDPKMALENSIYFSAPIAKMIDAHFLNKRMPKRKRNLIDGYIQRSFEMGLKQGKGSGSEGYGKASAKSTTQLDLNEECYSKSFPKMSLSAPAPLGIQFFMNCFILYILAALSSLMIHVSSIYFYLTNPLNNPLNN